MRGFELSRARRDLAVRPARADGNQLTVGAAVPLQTGVPWPGSGAAVFDNGAYVLVWDSGPRPCGPPGTGTDLVAARVDATGSILEAPQPIFALDGDERAVGLAHNSAGRMLLVYQRFDAADAFDTTRVRARVIGPGWPSTAVFAGPAGAADAGSVGGVDAGASGAAGASQSSNAAEPSTNVRGCGCRTASAPPFPLWITGALGLLIASCKIRSRRRRRLAHKRTCTV